MVTVRMLVGIVGPTAAVEPGDLYVCDQATAHRLVAEGQATFLGDPPPETAMRDVSFAERAVKPKAKARGAQS